MNFVNDLTLGSPCLHVKVGALDENGVLAPTSDVNVTLSEQGQLNTFAYVEPLEGRIQAMWLFTFM